MTVDTGDPEREVRSLVPRAHVQLGRLLLVLVPHEQTNVTSFSDPSPLLHLLLLGTERPHRDDSIVKPRRGGSGEDEVGETEAHRVLASVYQRAVGGTLHLGPESVGELPVTDITVNYNLQIYPLRHHDAVQETRQAGPLLLHELNNSTGANIYHSKFHTICMCLRTQFFNSPSELLCIK